MRTSALLLLVVAACRAGSPELAEFAGSYPAERATTGPVRSFEITAAPTTVPLLDGKALEVWAYNGQVPGPTLRVRLGETVRVAFKNHLPQPTTIHWHGVRLPNAMDGVPGVTQPAVPPGGSFVYEFTPKDAGTFWFHPHVRSSEQVERGLFGVLLVEDELPLPYTQDLVWVLDDWLLDDAGRIAPEFNTRHDLAHDGRWGRVVTVNGDAHARLRVRPGERIRLRLLDVANGRVFAPDFAGLAAEVIAVDGLYTARPLPATGFELAPGNRLDLDLSIPASAAGRRFVINDRFSRAPIPLVEISVDGDPVATPRFASPAAAHVPAWRSTTALPVAAEYRIDARAGGEYGIEWTLNGHAFRHGEHATPHEIKVLPRGRFSKVRFVNDSFRLHPMHVHGMFFKVLSRNGRPVDEPHFRDTVLLHSKDSVEVGLVPLDAGQWMLHCHVLEHAESGMMTLVEVR